MAKPCRGKAFVLIDSDINLNDERKTRIIESIKHNRMEVYEYKDAKTFKDILTEQVLSEEVLPSASNYDLISVIVIARKYPGPYEFRKYGIHDLYSSVTNSPLTADKNILLAIIMEDRFDMYSTDAVAETLTKDVKTICVFEAVCPVKKETNHFEIVLDQFTEYLLNASNEEDFVQSLQKIENDNTECGIDLFNPLQKPLYLGQ
ncbi:uncharacterized protein LOC143914834 [Arctopsyche grandis]|uniref:uncharacterized protein LOC143914834 n=1 Tax=Arctopsyche grandis TaxID=121162 RepID=UPI00406D6DCA